MCVLTLCSKQYCVVILVCLVSTFLSYVTVLWVWCLGWRKHWEQIVCNHTSKTTSWVLPVCPLWSGVEIPVIMNCFMSLGWWKHWNTGCPFSTLALRLGQYFVVILYCLVYTFLSCWTELWVRANKVLETGCQHSHFPHTNTVWLSSILWSTHFCHDELFYESVRIKAL